MSQKLEAELHLDQQTHPIPCEACEASFTRVYYSPGAFRVEINVLCYYLLYGSGPAYLEEILIYSQRDEDKPPRLTPTYNFGTLLAASSMLRRAEVIALSTNLIGRGGQSIFFVPGHEARLRPWPTDTPPMAKPSKPPRGIMGQLEDD